MTSAWGLGPSGGSYLNHYIYDAAGKRMGRQMALGKIWHVYGLDGELLAEYAAAGAPSAPLKEYGYRGGELLVVGEPGRQVRWLVTDHLVTPRMPADHTGSLASVRRHDYLPFGEEVGAASTGETAAQGYGQVDKVRQKFTGYEHDSETGLDFAQAGYYNSLQGRFSSREQTPCKCPPRRAADVVSIHLRRK